MSDQDDLKPEQGERPAAKGDGAANFRNFPWPLAPEEQVAADMEKALGETGKLEARDD